MKKSLWILLCLTFALLALIVGTFAQDKPGIVGTWAGHTFIGDGSRAEFILIVDKGSEGLTARITSETGMVPDMTCRNVSFAESELTFDIDFPEGMDVVLISVGLTLAGDTLKGSWANPNGETDVIELARKK
ncbi:MAG: hypothetical protein R6X21_09890 [Candidatus Aminicenantes bacterium]